MFTSQVIQWDVFLVLCLGIWWCHEIWKCTTLKCNFLGNKKSFWSEIKTFFLVWWVLSFRLKNKLAKMQQTQPLIYRKSVGPKMDPWRTPALTGYTCEDFPSRTTQSCLLLGGGEKKAKFMTSKRPMFVKNTRLPNSVESVGYIKCYSSSSHRHVKSPSNSIRHNSQKICIWSRRPKTILEIRKKAKFFWVINNPIICKFSKIKSLIKSSNHRKTTIS